MLALWPPALANAICVSFDIHHLTKSSASLVCKSVFQVIRTKGCPPMTDQRSTPLSVLRPGSCAKAILSATLEVSGWIELSANPIHSRLLATLPARKSSSALKMSRLPVVPSGGKYLTNDSRCSKDLTATSELTTPSACAFGCLVSSQMSPPCCQRNS